MRTMCRGLIGKKIGMTGIFSPEGKYIPVTVLQGGPCVVTQIKTIATDGYNALQLGFGEKKKSRVNKPMEGHLKTCGKGMFAFLREFSVDNPEEYTLGQEITIDILDHNKQLNNTRRKLWVPKEEKSSVWTSRKSSNC